MILNKFLDPLWSALDLSRAHYKNEIENVQNGKDVDKFSDMFQNTKILNGDPMGDISPERKLNMLKCALNNFDIINHLLARITEFMDSMI